MIGHAPRRPTHRYGKDTDVVRPKRGDPLQPRDTPKRLFDPLGGAHPPVAHQHQPLDLEATADLLHLGPKGARVGRVALEDFHGHRTALGVAQKPVDDLRIPNSPIAAVAELRQGAAASGVEAGAHIVEHQRALPQVLRSECVLDASLPLQQPVHGLVQRAFLLDVDPQLQSQRGGGTLLHERRGGGKLGTRLDDSWHDEGGPQAAVLGSPRTQEPLQTDLAERAQYGRHVSVRKGAQDLKGSAAGPGRQIAAEPTADGLDQVRGGGGEVGGGLVFDLAPLAIGAAQEVGFVDPALVGTPGCGYMDGPGSTSHADILRQSHDTVNTVSYILVATFCNELNQSIMFAANDLRPKKVA